MKAFVAGLAILAAAILVGMAGTATAAGTALSVDVRLSGADSVSVSGRTATASATVRFDRRSGLGWVLVKRTRAHAHRYATTLSVAPGTSATFRVTSNRTSRRFVVAMPARSSTPIPTAPAPTTAAPTTPAPTTPAPTTPAPTTPDPTTPAPTTPDPTTPAPTTPDPTTAPPVTYDACGAQPLKADGTPWSCTFHDDFNGTALDRTKWVPQTSFAVGSPEAYACYEDDPAYVNVGQGVLNLTVRQLDTPITCGGTIVPTSYVSGMVSTWHTFSQQYGRFEARLRNTASDYPGLAESFWLWPDDRFPSTETWPTAGEIDIAETYSSALDLAIPFLHYSADLDGPQPGINTAWDCTVNRGEWNTYTLEWAPSRLEIFVNGKSCLVNTSGDPAFQKAYIIDLTQGIGPGGNVPVADTPMPATLQVDYVRVWK